MEDEVFNVRMISSLDELDSFESFDAHVVIPVGGMALQGLSWNATADFGNKVEWLEAGSEKTKSSSDIFINWMLVTDDKPFQARVFGHDDVVAD